MNQLFSTLRRGLRVNLHLVSSYLKTHWKLFTLSLILGLAAIYFLPQSLSLLRANRSPAIALVGNYTITTLPPDLQKEISIGLTKLQPDGQATAGAATSWEATNSGKSVIFNLDKNLFWQDGTKFDASQINYNLKGVSVKRLNLYQIEFDFAEPFSPLPTVVSQPLFKNGLVGLGKNQVENLKFSGRFLGSITLRNLATGGKTIYKFYPTEKMAATALKLGAVDEVAGLHETFTLEKDKHFQIQTKIQTNTEAILFFNLRKDIFSEKSLRQGLIYSLPDQFSQGQTAQAPIPQNSWVGSNSAKKYPQNTTLAKTAVTKFASPSAKTKITITSNKELAPEADHIAQIWSSIGLPTIVSQSESVSDNFDVYLTYLDLPADPDQYALWHSTQTGNIPGYKSFKIDRLLEDGRKTFDQSQRQEIYANFLRAITEDVPAAFLFYPRLYDISRK